MSHWLHTMVDGAKFWIDCQQLATIGTLSRWQLIQNLTPSTNLWRQCDIPIVAGQLNVPRNIRICQLFVYLIKTKSRKVINSDSLPLFSQLFGLLQRYFLSIFLLWQKWMNLFTEKNQKKISYLFTQKQNMSSADCLQTNSYLRMLSWKIRILQFL